MDLIGTLFGLVFTGGGLYGIRHGRGVLRQFKLFEARALPARGVVVAHRWQSTGATVGGPGCQVAFPIVRWSLPDGTVVEHQGSSGQNPPSEFRGAEVDVFYDPQNPSVVCVGRHGVAKSHVGVWGATVLSACFAFGGAVSLLPS